MTPNVTDYDVVQGFNPFELTQRMRQKIMHGWQPYGKLIYYKTATDTYFCQPIVKMDMYTPKEERKEVGDGVALNSMVHPPGLIEKLSKKVVEWMSHIDEEGRMVYPLKEEKEGVKKRGRPKNAISK